MNVLKGNDISVAWTITKCDNTAENFTGTDLSVFVVNGYERVPVDFTVVGNVINVNIPGNLLEVGNYCLEAVWSKSGAWSRVLKRDVFFITNNPEAVNSVCGK